MISRATNAFWRAFAQLPEETKQQARTTYRLWRNSPYHPSLRFKRIHANEPIYSVRVGIGWRAVGVRKDTEVVWFWIGSHAAYDKLVAQFRRNL